MLLGLAWLMRRRPRALMRRARSGWCLLAIFVSLAVAESAHAQLALDTFRPAPLASDGFALSRPEVLREHRWGALAVLDFRARRVGVVGCLQLCGDPGADLAAIARHYAGAEGRHPHQATPVRLA